MSLQKRVIRIGVPITLIGMTNHTPKRLYFVMPFVQYQHFKRERHGISMTFSYICSRNGLSDLHQEAVSVCHFLEFHLTTAKGGEYNDQGK